MADGESQDIAALRAEVQKLVERYHEYIVARDEDRAVDALNAAAAAARDLLVARVESDEPPNKMTDNDHAVWRLVSTASDEYFHGNQKLGDWFAESARRRALQPYLELPVA
ncbi:hypothetical protein [Mycobacterium avium]|uniref:hypothetical protein n=1 Tax=Mycobacterium avium TaxID=1764 RepID=UPI000CE346CD|nr:hypothetical protein [Mycobacterium avium]